MTVLPFTTSSRPVTPGLRRAAEYHEGRTLTDGEVVAVLRREFEDVVTRWEQLGKWLVHLDTWGAVAAPKLSGVTTNNPPEDDVYKRSVALKQRWAEKRARGERLPSPASQARALRAARAAGRAT